MKWQTFSLLLLAVGTGFNIIGAVLNSFHYRIGFMVWMCSNTMFIIYFYGASRDWWQAEATGERTLMAMYCVFLTTATWGWIN